MKKFWEKVSIKKISSDSFCVMLDKRTLKTPLKRDLVLPNLNLAQEIVKEWDQDSKKINSESMIFYGLISTSLDKIIDNKSLSSGQMQKISFIRALVSNCEILLLDEATANLDDKSKEIIFDLLKDREITIINSTHDPTSFKNVDFNLDIEIINEKRIINLK